MKAWHWILAGFLLVSTAAKAESFRVVSRKGDVKILKLGSVEWEPLRSKELGHGTLMSLGNGARIELAHLVSATRQKERIRLEQAMIVRLDDGLLRDFRYKKYVIDRLFAGSKSELKAIKEKPVLTLKDAVQRYILKYEAKDIPKGRQVDPEVVPVSAGKTLIPIDLYAPADETVLFLEEGQAEVTMRWQPLGSGIRYQVYSWRATESRGDPLFETQETHALLRFKQTGRYRLAVSNADGSARSQTIQVQVLAPRLAGEARQSFLKSALRRDKMGLIPRQPAPHSEILQSSKDSTVTFAWKDAQPLGLDEVYVLQLKDEVGNVYRVKSPYLWVQTNVPFGRYRWRVTRENKISGESSKDTGAAWVLEVKPFEMAKLADGLHRALKDSSSLRQTIVLDLGR